MKFYKILTFYGQTGRGQGHVTYFLNFGTPSITFERIKLDTSFFLWYYFFVYFIMSLTVQCIVYLEIALCVRLLYNY